MRRLLTLLLCACMALQGMVSAMARETPCPMEAEMEAMVLAGELGADDLPDCCNDLQTWAETGQLCKPGLDFAGGMVWAPAPVPIPLGVGGGTCVLASPPPTAMNAPPGALWRPPAQA